MVFALLGLDPREILDAVLQNKAVQSVRVWLRRVAPAAGVTAGPSRAESRSEIPPPAQETPAVATTPERPTLPANAAADREFELRRAETRLRFDALFDRMLALEDTMDALGKRVALRAVHERHSEQRALDRIDVLSEAIERRNLEFEAITAVLTRIEQRLERVERRLRDDSSHQSRDGIRTEADELSERAERRTTDARRLSRTAPEDAPELWDVAPFSASSMRGNLAEVSLPTILGMLELERRTGVLKVCADDGSIVSATLRDGSLVGARVKELETEPLEALREALLFKRGHFWFRQLGVEVAMGPPKSVGSVLLEATRQNDEARRSA
jgi:hypothetical protein